MTVGLDRGVAGIAGNERPLGDLRATADSLSFEVDLGSQLLAFAGDVEGDSVSGEVTASLAGEDTPPSRFAFTLYRLPVLDPPGSREEAWRHDLIHARNRFLRYDRSYSAEGRARAEALLDRLDRDLADLEDAAIIARLAEVAATSGNAHTRLYLLRNRTALRRIPLRLWWFADGLRVIRASDRYAEALGCRVDGVGGRPARTARAAVSRMFAGNDGWTDYKSAYFLTAPSALAGVGVGVLRDGPDGSGDPVGVALDLACDEGPRSLDVQAAPLARSEEPTENWRNLSPLFEGELDLLPPEEGAWRSLPEAADVPLYLRHPDRHYWHEVLGDARAVYVQYNRSQSQAGQESIGDFERRVLAVLDHPGIDRAVVDLRFNTGGDLGAARGFFDRLVEHPDLAAGGRLAVITDQATFSAGLFHAAQLRASGRAILVGREPGDRLDYWSEGGNIVLPHSGYTLHFSNGYHSYSGRPDPSVQRVFQSLSVESLRPDIEVRPAFASYRAGEDPLLDAALEGIGSSPDE